MNKARIVLLILGVVLIGTGLLLSRKKQENSAPKTVRQSQSSQLKFAQPVDKSDQRVTKKPFGIFVTPTDSPVQPEHFTGFHTGTDFEILPGEETIDVPFYAICEGMLLQKRTATGYGGVVVQACKIDNQDVTVVYGHIKLRSVTKNYGDILKQGEKIGFLGQPPTETSGERKHLHLGIHKGIGMDIRGYVQVQAELTNWLDFQKL